MKVKPVAVSSASNLLLYSANLTVTYFLSPELVRALGNARYGLWEIVLSFAGYLGVLDLGVSPAIVRYVARLRADNNDKALQAVVSSGIVALALAGAVSMLAMTALAFFPQLASSSGPDASRGWSTAALCVGAMLLVQFPGSMFSAFLMGQQRYLAVNVCRVVVTILRMFAILYGLRCVTVDPLVWLAVITLLSTCVEFTALAFLAVRSAPAPFFLWAARSGATLRALVKFGINSAFLMAAQRLVFMSAPIVIAHSLGTAMVVFFSIPSRLATYTNGIAIALGGPLMPYFSAKSCEVPERIQDAWISVTRAIQSVSLITPIALLLVGPPFITLWMGPEYGRASSRILPYLCFAQLVEGISPHSVTYLVGQAKHARLFRFNLVAAILGVVATVLLVKGIGLPGVAVAILAYMTATRVYAMRQACDDLGISIYSHLRRTIVRHLPALAVFSAILLIGRLACPVASYSAIIVLLTASTLGYVACAFASSLTPDERGQLLSTIGWRRQRFPGGSR
ncbi:MAG: lipopolysaccharide biosynthesis protein [Candidatus Eisenbacteria bacterium]